MTEQIEVTHSLFDKSNTWSQQDFGLDRRLIKGLSKLGYMYPTLVQSKSLPISLQGKDILVRARTGSGKTIAFALPVVQKILESKTNPISDASIKAIILAPTKELVAQIEKCFNDLIFYCRDFVSVFSTISDNQKVIDSKIRSKPDIIVSTPSKLAQQCQAKKIDLTSVQLLVIDEADLVLSYGYKQDVHTVLAGLPKIVQGILMSATLSSELDKFKKVVLHNPAILRLEEDKSQGNLLQFYLEATESDKFLTLYVFLKLGLLQGKGLIFVNDINKCYRLKLFLQQFFISAAVLNAQVPLNSRTHILEEFNRGVFDYLIATDAAVDAGDEDDFDEEDNEDDEEEEFDEDDEEEFPDDDEENEEEDVDEENDDEVDMADIDEEEEEDQNEDDDDDEDAESGGSGDNRKRKNKSNDALKGKKLVEADEYGVSRGIDFTNVSFVVNFDFPVTSAAYIHRIGRTARGMQTGTALSFVLSDRPGIAPVKDADQIRARDLTVLTDVRERQPRLGVVEGDNVLNAIGAMDEALGHNHFQGQDDQHRMQPAPLVFNARELDSFRYRVEDTLRSVTQVAVRELRSAEIRREILNSEKLKTYFTENPSDLKVLRHDKAILHPIQQKDHLKFVPSYLIPDSMKAVAQVQGGRRRKRKAPAGNNDAHQDKRKKQRSKDPLYGGGSGGNSKNQDSNSSHQPSSDDKKYRQYGEGNSGRKEWKIRHKKGEFNPQLQKKNASKTPGTFHKKHGNKR
jgi:ATP-dependent RNA helicase DDX56/DBP9